MKGNRILGVLVILLAVVIAVGGFIGTRLDPKEGDLSAALEQTTLISTHAKAASKTAPAAIKKAASAQSAVTDANDDITSALANANTLLTANDATGDETIDALLACNTEETLVLANNMLLVKYQGFVSDARKAYDDAIGKCTAAQESIADLHKTFALEYTGTAIAAEEITEDTTSPESCIATIESYQAACAELTEEADKLAEEAQSTQEAADGIVSQDSISTQYRFLVFLYQNWIGFFFTAAALIILGIILMFFADTFAAKWRNVPVFSTGIALIALIAIQTYALGFQYPDITTWLTEWFKNAMNVLRANSSVGMIALGMTFVIISGGIDLAVGSTLAGIATIIMCIIDVSKNGILANMGIVGLPAYLIACGVGIIAGLLMGTLTGGIITKGKVPPFIVTLGMMQLIRSVAQYFTKSYSPEIPKQFEGLANTVIGGQMLLPIVYWLVLALIMHIVSKHTAFGRHVYAVGSNERTTMLSGINTNKVKMKVYILMGFIVALAAILQVSRLRGVDVSSAGSGYEMNAIASVVVGGTSMAGGIGTIFGTVLGVLIIGVMNNLLVLLNIDSFLSSAFTGAIVIAAVLMQRKQK